MKIFLGAVNTHDIYNVQKSIYLGGGGAIAPSGFFHKQFPRVVCVDPSLVLLHFY